MKRMKHSYPQKDKCWFKHWCFEMSPMGCYTDSADTYVDLLSS